ncbi:MAG: hypothetical protein JNJ48_08765, partial [Phycisphaerae bacterium]|nr:hypothetical protein [Phycisphaerae bacterium]
FSDVYGKYSEVIRPDAVVFLTGKVDHARGEPQIIVESVVPLESATSALARKVRLTVDERRHNGSSESVLERVLGVIRPAAPAGRPAPRPAAPGVPSLGVEIVVLTEQHEVWLEAGALRLAASDEAVGDLRELLGDDNVTMVGAQVEVARREPKPWERKRSPAGE